MKNLKSLKHKLTQHNIGFEQHKSLITIRKFNLIFTASCDDRGKWTCELTDGNKSNSITIQQFCSYAGLSLS